MVSFIPLIGAGVSVLVFFAVGFYLLALYCHPQDKGVGTSISSKILIILGQTIAWSQLLLITLDIAIQDPSIMQIIYSVVYAFIFVLIVFIIPFTSAIYQSDEDDSWLKRIFSSLLYAMVIAFVWSLYTFISYIFLSVYTNSSGSQERVNIFFYIMLSQSIIGWVLLAINGAIGLSFLPYDTIQAFTKRPKKISKQQALQMKKQLQNRSDQLIQEGQRLIADEAEFSQKSSQMNWFSKKRKQSHFKDLLSAFKKQINQLEQDYENFNGVLHISQQNPIIPYLKLLTGIFCIFLSIIWLAQLLGMTIYIDGSPLFDFLDPIMSTLLSGSASFAATIIFGLLVLYMQICLIKGNSVFGIKIPYVIAFNPLQINKTYLNSLLFNISMMMLTSLSITQMAIIVFPEYLKSSYLYTFYSTQVFNKLPIFGQLFGERIYTIVFLSLFGLSIVYLIIRKCRQKKSRKSLKDK